MVNTGASRWLAGDPSACGKEARISGLRNVPASGAEFGSSGVSGFVSSDIKSYTLSVTHFQHGISCYLLPSLEQYPIKHAADVTLALDHLTKSPEQSNP